MSLACLYELLSQVDTDRVLWISPTGEKITADSIVTGSFIDTESWRGRNVAIEADSPSDLARCLVALDGICDSILLLPSGLSHDEQDSLRQRAGVDGRVTGTDLAFNQTVGHSTLRDTATRWILATSGTTGTPKLVQHTLASLTRTASFDLQIGSTHVWSSLYHLTGFAGLQVFLQAWCGGSAFVMHDDQSTLNQRVDRMSRFGVTALSATPTMWRKILMTGNSGSLALRRITLGGEIADQKILDALSGTFPDAKIVQIYASTEAGVGFSVRDGKAGFPASYLQHPPGDVEIKVQDGQLLIRNATSTQQLLGDDGTLRGSDGFIDTGDRVKGVDDRFEFLGRANGSINVGGSKVHPEEVERFLMSCEGVVQARVYAKKSSFTGSLVAADVIPQSAADGPALRKRLIADCRGGLDAYKVPAIIRMVDEFETNAAGKMKRIS